MGCNASRAPGSGRRPSRSPGPLGLANDPLMFNGRAGVRHDHGCPVHVAILAGRFGIHRDGTEYGIAQELLDAGIPKSRIVRALRSPSAHRRPDFAVSSPAARPRAPIYPYALIDPWSEGGDTMLGRVLVLSASAGAGHLRAAEAVEKAIRLRGAATEVQHLDVLKYTNQVFRNLYSKTYIDLRSE